MPSYDELVVGARNSELSRAQVKEVTALFPEIRFVLNAIETTGDKDQKTSLRNLNKTDFFTKEIDQMLLNEECRIAIHSAKDLPDPLPKGLVMVALTEGVDSSDALVFNEELFPGALVGVSCERRERAVKAFREDLVCTDIRGTIERRLALVDTHQLQAVVVAEAALIRLGMTGRHRVRLKGATTPLQGKLAILAREGDLEMQQLFSSIDLRQKQVLYLGLDPSHYAGGGRVTHFPIIRVEKRESDLVDLSTFTHLIFTSKSGVGFFCEQYGTSPRLHAMVVISIGEVTTLHLQQRGIEPAFVAPYATQEGVIELLTGLALENASFLLPGSSRSRPLIIDYLQKRGIAYKSLNLYDTVEARGELPLLAEFDEIIFTSPSTVEAFFGRSPQLAKKTKLRAIGPVTSNALDSMILR